MGLSENDRELYLVRRVQLISDKSAFDELIRINKDRVLGFLFRLCGGSDKYKDLSQECFVTAYSKIRQYKPSGKFSSWLLTIAYNIYLQDRRKNERRKNIERNTWNASNDDTASTEFREPIIDLENAIGKLSSVERACITLNHAYGYSHSEIAEMLDIPLGTTKTNIKRALQKLRTTLNILDD